MILAILSASCGLASSGENDTIYHASAEDFYGLAFQDTVQLVDIRTPAEYTQGHIEGAKLINYYDDRFLEEMSKLDTDTTILIYCRSGSRSSRAASQLKALGFSRIVNLRRGILDWQRSGYPLVTE